MGVSLGLAGASTDLGEQQINTKGSVLVIQEALELCNLLTEHVGGVSDTSNDSQTTGVGDRSGQLRAGGHVHTRQEDGVIDLEQISKSSTDFFYKSRMALVFKIPEDSGALHSAYEEAVARNSRGEAILEYLKRR